MKRSYLLEISDTDDSRIRIAIHDLGNRDVSDLVANITTVVSETVITSSAASVTVVKDYILNEALEEARRRIQEREEQHRGGVTAHV